MVAKITILEPHFDGAQFGPASIEGPMAEWGDETNSKTTTDADADETAGSKSRLTTLLRRVTVIVLLFVALWVVLSRLLAADEPETE